MSPQLLKSLSADLISANAVLLCCSTCQTTFSSGLQFDRVLPSPSVHWTDLASEWFCGCSNFSTCCGNDEPKHGYNGCKVDGDKKEGDVIIKNKQLSAFDLRPRDKDLLHGPGFFLLRESESLSSSSFKIHRSQRSASEVHCNVCDSCVGTYFTSQGMFQVWQHSVLLMTTNGTSLWPRSCSSDTFLSLLTAMIDDQPQRMVEVAFECRQEGVKNDLLTVKVMERKLQLLSCDFPTGSSMHRENQRQFLKTGSGCKLLFKIGEKSLRDWQIQVMDVSKEIWDAGLQLLVKGQQWLPSCFREDRGWRIAILHCDAEEKQTLECSTNVFSEN